LLVLVVKRGKDSDRQLRGATPVSELEQRVHVVPCVASNGARELGGEAGVAKPIDSPGYERLEIA
jgi:hypothetical protein